MKLKYFVLITKYNNIKNIFDKCLRFTKYLKKQIFLRFEDIMNYDISIINIKNPEDSK